MKHTTSIHRRLRGMRTLLAAVLVVAFGVAGMTETAHAASTFGPTLLVNTEAFTSLDSGDGSSNIELRFGTASNWRLYWDFSGNRFVITQPLWVQGTLTASGTSIKRIMSGSALRVDQNADIWGNLAVSGSTTLKGNQTVNGNAKVRGTFSGSSLRIDQNADIWGSLSATGSLKTKSGAVINSGNSANDASLTFGNATAPQALKFLNGLQTFVLTAPLRVNGNLSASGTLAVQNDINTRADMALNNDNGNVDAKITFGNGTAAQVARYSHGNQRFELSKDLAVTGKITASGASIKGVLSGSALRVDKNADIWGNLAVSGSTTFNKVTYTWTGSQGGANQVLTNNGAGALSWASPSIGSSSGKVLSLVPEYANAVYFQSGSTAVGTLTDSSSGALDNFYHWTTTRSALQDYWISVRVQVPKNFTHFETASGIQLRLRTNTTSAANNYVTFRLMDTTGTRVNTGVSGDSLVSTLANTFVTKTITGVNTGTFAPLGYFTMLIKMASTSAGFADAGFINLNWSTASP